MAQSRYYSSTAQPTTLSASMNASQTTAALTAVVGFPATTPYVLALGYGTATEELVLVNTIAGTNLTSITRGFDGTAASSHTAGDAVRHVWCGMDGNDSRAHEGAANLVHGITGNVVGTTDSQTLTNKTLTSPTINTPTVSGGTYSGSPTFTSTPIFSGFPNFQGGFQAGSTGQMQVSNSGILTSGPIASSSSINTTSTLTTGSTGQFTVTAAGAVATTSTLSVGTTAQFAVTAAGAFSSTGAFNGASNVNTGAWTTYTPTWTASTTNPVIGNGTLTGNYVLIGKMCTVTFTMVANTTTTFGSGTYAFALPFASVNSGVPHVGGAQIQVTGATGIRVNALLLVPNNSTTMTLYAPTTATNVGTSGTQIGSSGVAGGTWAATTNDLIRATVTYQIA